MTSFPAPARFDDADEALERVETIYQRSVEHLRDALRRFAAGESFDERVRACYPLVRIRVDSVSRPDSRLAFGFLPGPGLYETTLTRPDLFERYYREQFRPPHARAAPAVARPFRPARPGGHG